ncbi:MAG: type II secretion system GspH family protein [Patescibacteria group bacterium]|nr:type II secretion system GspH family protein [Patescibacteria group bacterium]
MRSEKSFTLVEILVLMVIASVFFGLFIPNYQRFEQERILQNQARNFSQVFELVKKKAFSSELHDKNCQNFSGYKLTIKSNNNYSFSFGCHTNFYEIQNYYLNQNNFFTEAIGKEFYFSPTGRLIDIGGVSTLRIKNEIINKCIEININERGIMTVNYFLINC